MTEPCWESYLQQEFWELPS